MTNYVLIPGAGGASWSWSYVARLLAQRGHDVVAVDLPGPDPASGLPEYTAATVRAAGDRTDVVLVAHSLGAFTAPLAAAQLSVREVVLVNAMIPLPGETPGAWWGATGVIEARDAAARAGGYGPFDVHTYFEHDVPPEVVADGAAYDVEEVDAVFGTVCDFDAWPSVPLHVLAGEQDRFFPVGFQQRLARERLGVEPDVLPGGHLIALSQPSAVADYLDRG